MNSTCHYCRQSKHRGDLRPYGPGAALVCYECGSSPEHLEQTNAALGALMDAVGEVSPNGGIVLGHPDGPQPLTPQSLSEAEQEAHRER